MSNLILTNYCNRSCPYCFAKEKVSNIDNETDSDHISFEDIKTFVNYLKKSDIDQFRLLGGEPTLHPDFKKIVQLGIENNLRIQVFTNGIISEDIVNFLKNNKDKGKGVNFLLNINELDEYNENEVKLLKSFMENLNEHICLGVNIYKKNQNLDFLIDIIKKYNLCRELRVGFATPLIGAKNCYIKTSEYKSVIKTLVDFSKKCFDEEIMLKNDCGNLMFCDLDSTDAGLLYKNGYYIPRTVCDVPIDVGRNLNMWRCFATSSLFNTNLTEFDNFHEAREYFDKKFEVFKKLGSKEQCVDCIHLKRGLCQGGCFALIHKSFKSFDEKNSYNFNKNFNYRLGKNSSQIVNFSDNKLISLDYVSTFIFRKMLEDKNKKEIINQVIHTFDNVTMDVAQKDFDDFLKVLKNNKILNN